MSEEKPEEKKKDEEIPEWKHLEKLLKDALNSSSQTPPPGDEGTPPPSSPPPEEPAPEVKILTEIADG